MSTNFIFFLSSAIEEYPFLFRQAGLVQSASKATTTGSTYLNPVGFPVLVPDGLNSVEGLLLNVSANDIFLTILDEVMGFSPQNEVSSIHLRRLIKVKLNDGAEVEAYAYVANLEHPKIAFKIVPNGQWQKVTELNPPIPHRLNDKQKNYISRLAKTSGREIIPIDLPLYRELMNLELVIDKGRRIALTKLGQDVYRYL